MGFIDTLDHYFDGVSPARLQAHDNGGQVDFLLPLDDSWTRDAVAFRTSSSTPFGTWWSGASAG